LNAAHFYKAAIATKIESGGFYPAEAYHQRYYLNNGHEPYCHAIPPGLLEELGLVNA
jgi:peptide-methionine (S)-S-oxide reductase